jgi:hypothetical protein
MGERIVSGSILIVLSKNKKARLGRALGYSIYPADSPSTLIQAIPVPDHCAILWPDCCQSVLGLDDEQSFF